MTRRSLRAYNTTMTIFLLALTLLFSPLYAQELTSKGEIALGFRFFEDDNLAQTQDQQLLLFVENQSKANLSFGEAYLGFIGRMDSKESARSFFSFTDTYLSYDSLKDFQFFAGFRIFDWSSLEAFHPADQINSRNFDSHFFDYQKLGEFTLGSEYLLSDYQIKFGAYIFPYFKKPHYPSSRSRLGEQYDIQDTVIVDGTQKSSDQQVFQFGLMAESNNTKEEGDHWRVHYLRLVDRWRVLYGTTQYSYNSATNTYTPFSSNSLTSTPNAYHAMMNQLGGSWNYSKESWTLKLEGAARWYSSGAAVLTKRGLRTVVNHNEVGVGLDKSFQMNYGLVKSFIEFGGLFDLNKRTRSELSYLQRDLLLGSWVHLDDVSQTSLKAALDIDLERSKEYAIELFGKRKLTQNWGVEGGLRYFYAPSSSSTPTGLQILHKDSYLFSSLTRSF